MMVRRWHRSPRDAVRALSRPVSHRIRRHARQTRGAMALRGN